MNNQRNDDFQCDKPSKERIMQAMKQYYEANSNRTFNYWIDPNPIADIDCYATATTTNGQEVTYAIECKEREQEYYEMFCEEKKYEDLKNANAERKYIANELPSGKILIWNFEDIDPEHYCWKWIARTTKGSSQKQRKKELQKRILMPQSKAKIIKNARKWK